MSVSEVNDIENPLYSYYQSQIIDQSQSIPQRQKKKINGRFMKAKNDWIRIRAMIFLLRHTNKSITNNKRS